MRERCERVERKERRERDERKDWGRFPKGWPRVVHGYVGRVRERERG